MHYSLLYTVCLIFSAYYNSLTIFNRTEFPQLNLIHSFVYIGMLFHL